MNNIIDDIFLLLNKPNQLQTHTQDTHTKPLPKNVDSKQNDLKTKKISKKRNSRIHMTT